MLRFFPDEAYGYKYPDSYIRLILEVAGMPRCLDIVETREQAVTLVTS